MLDSTGRPWTNEPNDRLWPISGAAPTGAERLTTAPSRLPFFRTILPKWVFSASRPDRQLGWIRDHFDAGRYLAANPDVAAAGMDPLAHFLAFGLLEGRAPESGVSNLRCRQELIGAFGTEQDLLRQVARLRTLLMVSKPPATQHEPGAGAVQPPFWARQDFAARVIDLWHIRGSAEWASGRATRESAVRQFATQFETRLLPFSPELAPDPEFYRALCGQELTALEIQQAWAGSEREDQTLVSMAHFLRVHCGDANLVYDGFDHPAYIARNPDVDLRLNEIQAFAHFILEGLEKGLRPPPVISPALAAIIDARLERLNDTGGFGLFKAATRLFDADVRTDVITRFACQHAIANSFVDTAFAMQQAALPRQTGDDPAGDRLCAFWISYHMATELAQQGRHHDAVRLAQDALSHENGSVLALEHAHDKVSLWHQDIHRAMRVAARSDRQMPDEPAVSERFTAILQAIPAFHATAPAVLPARPRGQIRRIGILADLMLPQCKRYRVDQKLEYLGAIGVDVTVYDVHRELDQAVSDCALYDAWVFYRTPAFYGVLRLLSRATSLGLPTIFEIDDLVFSPDHFPEARENYGAGVDDNLYAEFRVLPFLYAAVARNCDHGLASTRVLADHLGALVRSGRCFVLPNGLDQVHENAVSALGPLPARRPDDPVRVFVGSATRSHKDHVAKIFVPQALRVAEQFAGKVHFTFCGEFDEIHANLDEQARRSIGHIELSWDYAAYVATLSGFDINVVPLEQSVFTDCKSEIKWLEAGMLGVPSVLTPTDAYKRCIEDGVTGVLVRDDDYVTPISRLCASRAERSGIGEAARQAVNAGFSPLRQAEALARILDEIGGVT